MKILKSIQDLYHSNEDYYAIVKEKVEALLNFKKKSSWHYIGRIKTLESFALKIETGRFNEASIFDDFFACTIVVENINEIKNANSLINKLFINQYQKPQSQYFTHKSSDSFQFDDLRIYCRLKEDELKPLSDDVLKLTFEIQIKTFLQHAWSIATHDLIYKSDEVHWGKERIAFQVKAALEQAEVAISGVNELSKVSEISKDTKDIKKINRLLKLLYKHFKKEDLPKDRRRLAHNIINLLSILKLDLTSFDKYLIDDTNAGKGTNLRNLSPYMLIVQSIYNQNSSLIESFLKSKNYERTKFLITPELNFKQIDDMQKHNIIDLR